MSAGSLQAAWFREASQALARLEREAQGEVQAAAALSAARMAAGGALHHFDTGHTAREPVRRAGGLVALHAIEVDYQLQHPLPPGREPGGLKQSYYYDSEELGRMVAQRSHLRAGDVLWLVSNSGREAFPLALALEARARGVAVVAVTCVAFSRAAEARHPSGKRLYEVADCVIDTRGPVGDASVPVAALGTPIAPLSGLLNVAACWALVSATIEELLARGVTPSVYRSVNLPDGFAWNDRVEAAYRTRGI